MVIAAVFVGVIIIGLIGLIIFMNHFDYGDMSTNIFFGTWLIICCIIEIGMIVDITSKPRPKAMDVHQGKTTLEYKVVDGVKVDSVVIFKNDTIGLKKFY